MGSGDEDVRRNWWAGRSIFATGSTSRPSPSRANAPRIGTSPSSPRTTRLGLLLRSKVRPAHASLRATSTPFARVNVRVSTTRRPSSSASGRGTTGYVAPVSTTTSSSFVFSGSWRLNTRTRTLKRPMYRRSPRIVLNSLGKGLESANPTQPAARDLSRSGGARAGWGRHDVLPLQDNVYYPYWVI